MTDKQPDYKCSRGACRKDLTRKEFGKNVAYFCPDHGVVRTEMYYAKAEDLAPVVEPPVVESPTVEITATPIPEEAPVSVVEVKPKRTRARKAEEAAKAALEA